MANDYNFEKYYKSALHNFNFYKTRIESILSKSKPILLEEFRFNSVIYRSKGDWIFKFKTKFGNFFISSNAALGSINDVWCFIDALCLKKEIAFWFSDQEGPDAFLYAETVDDKYIRLALFSNGWWDKTPLPNQAKNESDFYIPLQCDFIVKRNSLIAALDIELRNGFSGGSKKDWLDSSWDCWSGKLYSHEVANYFSPSKETLLGEKSLWEFLSLPIDVLKDCLDKGFNPNCLSSGDYGSVNPLVILSEGNNEILSNSGETEKLKKKFEKLKLFISYGAEPNFDSGDHPWNRTALETAVSTLAPIETIDLLLSLGAKDTNLCWQIVKKYRNYKGKGDKYFQDVYKLFQKYGEPITYANLEITKAGKKLLLRLSKMFPSKKDL
jgi:hypothetical protein